MEDVSKLVLKVESKQVNKASKELKDFSGKADKADKSTDKLNKTTDKSSRSLKEMHGSLSKSKGGLDLLSGSALGLTTKLAGFLSVGFAINKTFRETASLQKYNAQLKTATGSAEDASLAWDKLNKFAEKTPFAINQSIEAFIKLKNLGLTPSEEALESYGNTASAMGKDLTQLIEAVADATTGEFERLKEFGIKSRSEGENVKFTFRGVTTQVGKNAKEIEDFLIKLGQLNFSGSMSEQMDTLGGKSYNFADAWDNLFRTIGDGPVGEIMKQTLDIGTNALKNLNDVLTDNEALLKRRGNTSKRIYGGGRNSTKSSEDLELARIRQEAENRVNSNNPGGFKDKIVSRGFNGRRGKDIISAERQFEAAVNREIENIKSRKAASEKLNNEMIAFLKDQEEKAQAERAEELRIIEVKQKNLEYINNLKLKLEEDNLSAQEKLVKTKERINNLINDSSSDGTALSSKSDKGQQLSILLNEKRRIEKEIEQTQKDRINESVKIELEQERIGLRKTVDVLVEREKFEQAINVLLDKRAEFQRRLNGPDKSSSDVLEIENIDSQIKSIKDLQQSKKESYERDLERKKQLAEKTLKSQKKEFNSLKKSLRTEEEAIEESYKNRLKIILKNTEEGTLERLDLIERLEAEKKDKLKNINKKITDDFKDENQRIKNFYDSTIDDMGDSLFRFTQNGKFDFEDMAGSIISNIQKIAFEMAIIEPLKNSFGLGGSSSSGGFGNVISSIGSAVGGYFTGGAPSGIYSAHHSGGIVGSSSMSRSVGIGAFNNATRYHTGGIAGMRPDEVPAILQRGEEVVTRKDPRHRDNGGGGTTVNIINESGGQVETQQRQNGSESIVDVIIKQAESFIGTRLSTGRGIGPIIERKYNLSPTLGR